MTLSTVATTATITTPLRGYYGRSLGFLTGEPVRGLTEVQKAWQARQALANMSGQGEGAGGRDGGLRGRGVWCNSTLRFSACGGRWKLQNCGRRVLTPKTVRR